MLFRSLTFEDQERSLLAVDRAIGDLLAALSDRGTLRDTLLVFTSDNGILLGEHRWMKKEVPYEEAIRVPLVIRWDAVGAIPGHDRTHLALNVDLAPTIAEAAGVAAPNAEGASLVSLLAGADPPWRTSFLIEHLQGANKVPSYCGIHELDRVYVRYATGEEELYDLVADPFQLSNLAGDPARANELSQLRAQLYRLCAPAPPGYYGIARSRATWWAIAALTLGLLAAAASERRATRS